MSTEDIPTGGVVYRINVSRGGVPKLPVEVATVKVLGITGDLHRDTRNHGGPERALCLFTLEGIERLQREGHPIAAGTAGENITLAGVDLAALVPGTRLLLGDEVHVEVTTYTIPCKNIRDSFSDGDFTRIAHTLHPGESRVYARVLRGGELRQGDPARIIETSAFMES